MKSEGCEPKKLSQVTVQPLWKQGADGRQYAHSQLRLRGAWLLDIFPPRTRVHVACEEREGQTVLVIGAVEPVEGANDENAMG